MKAAKRLGGSTKCFSIEDEGPMCPRRGRDGWVGPLSEPMRGGMLRDLIIELLAILWVRRALSVAGGKMK